MMTYAKQNKGSHPRQDVKEGQACSKRKISRRAKPAPKKDVKEGQSCTSEGWRRGGLNLHPSIAWKKERWAKPAPRILPSM